MEVGVIILGPQSCDSYLTLGRCVLCVCGFDRGGEVSRTTRMSLIRPYGRTGVCQPPHTTYTC